MPHKLARRCLSLLLVSVPFLGSRPARGQAAPEVTSISPEAAVTTPGSTVMIIGSNFSPGAVVYFDGLEARQPRFINSSAIQVVTPYLRPGPAKVQMKIGPTVTQAAAAFVALPSPIDATIDRALNLARRGQFSTAIDTLTAVAKSDQDYQVKAFAYYEIAQLYLSHGDLWRAAGVPIYGDADKEGAAVQTCWRYRLVGDESNYFLPISNDPNAALKLADYTVEKDVTQNPEPRFFRALVNARYGDLTKAKADSTFILKSNPENPSYRALAAYIAVLGGDKTQLETLLGQTPSDARALSLLGQAAYLTGNYAAAHSWWNAEREISSVEAIRSYWAGKKHLTFGQKRVAAALLAECSAVAPDSKEGKEAAKLLADMGTPPH